MTENQSLGHLALIMSAQANTEAQDNRINFWYLSYSFNYVLPSTYR